MKSNRGGRPAQYSHEQLLKILLQYTEDNPNQTVKLYELEKATGIKRHVWSYNMMDEINKINREIQKVNIARTGISPFPSAEQILISCKGDEKKLTAQIESLLDMVRNLSKYQDAELAAKVMQRDYENKIDELEYIIKEKEKKIEGLFAEINKLTVDSGNPNTRKEKGIKSNIIELTPQNIEEFKSRAERLLL